MSKSKVAARPECVILVGLPAAGKTTLFESRFARTHDHLSNDLWPSARDRGHRLRAALAAALSNGRSVVVDNTNPTPSDRRTIIEVARAHGARVPNVAVFTAAKKRQPPAAAEGFDELVHLALDKAGSLVATVRGK